MRQDEALARLREAAEAVGARGSLLFHLDLAAALAVEALGAAGVASDLYAALVDEDGYGVLALAEDGGGAPRELALVRFAADGRPVVTTRDGPPVPEHLAQARARRTAARAASVEAGVGTGVGAGEGAGVGTERHAAVAFPRPRAALGDDPFEAYLLRLPPLETPADVVLGVHRHLLLSADGATVIADRPLSRGPLTLPSANGRSPYGIEVTHFGAVPGEIHVWASLRHGVGLRVIALDSMQMWDVEGERITHAGAVPAAD